MEIDIKNIKKILIIQYQPFGDVLLNTGCLPALREKFPSAKIDFLVRKPYQVVLENNPYLDEVVTFENKKGISYFFERIRIIRAIRKRRYDLLLDQIRGTGSAQITLFSGVKYRLGYENLRWKSFYNIRAPRGNNRYYSSLKFDLLKPLGIDEMPHELYFFIKPESFEYIDNWLKANQLHGTRIICFSPGSPVPRKQWKLENYAQLADKILEKTDRQVLLLWGPGEKQAVDTIIKLMKKKATLALPTDFNQAAAMLKRCELLVCNDGGINHLSVAVKTPSLAIFGSTNPLKWTATNFEGHYYLHNPDVNSKLDSTFGITPEMVFNKIMEIIQ